MKEKILKVAFVRYNKIEPSTGIGSVCLHLEDELMKYADINLVKINPPIRIKKKHFVFKLLNKIFFELWYLIILPLYCKFKKVDIYIEMNMIFPSFRFAKFYFFIYDLAFVKLPDTVLKTNYSRRISFLNKIDLEIDKIFAISESTKRDFIEFKTHTDNSNVIVTPLANSLEVFGGESPRLISERYFLFVGTLEPRKNLSNIIKAFYEFSDITRSDFKLILIGKRGWLADEIFDTINSNINHKDKVIIPGYLDDKELSAAYKHAFALVYASLYEGFGLPILEAMNHGIPVITSKNSSLPEIGGDAVIYCDTNAQSIKTSMLSLYESRELHDVIIERGYEQARKFSWKKFGEIMHKNLMHQNKI